jgi:hypothetical protein
VEPTTRVELVTYCLRIKFYSFIEIY